MVVKCLTNHLTYWLTIFLLEKLTVIWQRNSQPLLRPINLSPSPQDTTDQYLEPDGTNLQPYTTFFSINFSDILQVCSETFKFLSTFQGCQPKFCTHFSVFCVRYLPTHLILLYLFILMFSYEMWNFQPPLHDNFLTLLLLPS
jgi:hypothetical protein